MYTSKNQSRSAKDRSRKALARLDCSLMMKATSANSTEGAIKKRVEGFRKFCKDNPDYFSNAMYRAHRNDPTMRKRAIFTRTHCADGVQVVEYQECTREGDSGVVHYGP